MNQAFKVIKSIKAPTSSNTYLVAPDGMSYLLDGSASGHPVMPANNTIGDELFQMFTQACKEEGIPVHFVGSRHQPKPPYNPKPLSERIFSMGYTERELHYMPTPQEMDELHHFAHMTNALRDLLSIANLTIEGDATPIITSKKFDMNIGGGESLERIRGFEATSQFHWYVTQAGTRIWYESNATNGFRSIIASDGKKVF